MALLGRTGTSPGASLDSEQGIYHKALQLGRSNIKLKYGTSWDMPTLSWTPDHHLHPVLPLSHPLLVIHISIHPVATALAQLGEGSWEGDLGALTVPTTLFFLPYPVSFNPVREHLMKVATTLSASSQYKLWEVKKMGSLKLSPEILKAGGGDLAKFCIWN